jgi:hypothetical protein
MAFPIIVYPSDPSSIPYEPTDEETGQTLQCVLGVWLALL